MYILLLINLIGNTLLTVVLLISSRNISLLNAYQKLYLVLSIILWILLCLIYLAKLLSLLYVKITKKFIKRKRLEIETKLRWIWIITNGCSYLFMLIGLIYDMVLIIKGEISSVVFPIIYFIICFVYFICSVIDFFFIDTIVRSICEIPIINNEDKPNKKKENDQLDIEENKTKLD